MRTEAAGRTIHEDVGDFLSFWVFQAGFRAQQNLCRKSTDRKLASACGAFDVQLIYGLDISTNCSDCARVQ